MIRINLLPREEIPRVRTIKMPELGAMTPVVVVAVILVACLTTFFVQKRTADRLTHEVELAREESQRLAPQIARIKQLTREREQLDQRLDAITELDRERYFRVHLLSELARKLPENSWLTRLEEVSPGTVEIEGITFSNFIVADFLRDLTTSPYYQSADLVRTQRGFISDVKVLEFMITANVSQPPVELAAGL